VTGPGPVMNEDNLPVRPDKECCLYYLNTGSCRSGPQCIFHHPPKLEREQELKKSLSKAGMPPPPGGMALPTMPDGAPMDAAPPSSTGSLSSGMAGMLEKLEALQAGAALAPTVDAPGGNGENQGSTENFQAQQAPMQPQQMLPPEPIKEVEYNEEGLPIRPGMQKCGHFLRSGRCNYGPTCRFDHPAGLGGLMAGSSGVGHFPGMIGGPMTDGAMAMRPGREQCPFLSRTGTCPFGPECRFDHSGKPTVVDDTAALSLSKPAEPTTKTKNKGLGGTRGRRPPPSGRRFDP